MHLNHLFLDAGLVTSRRTLTHLPTHSPAAASALIEQLASFGYNASWDIPDHDGPSVTTDAPEHVCDLALLALGYWPWEAV